MNKTKSVLTTNREPFEMMVSLNYCVCFFWVSEMSETCYDDLLAEKQAAVVYLLIEGIILSYEQSVRSKKTRSA